MVLFNTLDVNTEMDLVSSTLNQKTKFSNVFLPVRYRVARATG